MYRLRGALVQALLGAAYLLARHQEPLEAARSRVDSPPGNWRAFEVVVCEHKRYGMTVFGCDRASAEEQARLLFEECPRPLFDWKETVAFDVEVREAR